MAPLLLILLSAAPAEARIAAFVEELVALAGPETRLTRDGNTIRLSRDVLVQPANAPSASGLERHAFVLALTVSAVLDEKAQRARLQRALALERAAWKTVASLQCDGMEFSDRYVDGLCFRAKGPAQEKRVAASRAARDAWLAVPRFHREADFSVTMRPHRPELTAGCADCDAREAKVAAALTAYPD